MMDELTRINNELANLQRDLAKKNAELVSLNADKNRFLGMAAHDLRGPLGVILSYSSFLEDEAGHLLDDEQKEFVTTIKTTSRFMLQLVEELLDVTVIESGHLVLETEPVDLCALTHRMAQMNSVLATRKDIRIECAVANGDAASPVVVEADPGKIGQVFTNLLSNAIKFSPPGTKVSVAIRADDDRATVRVTDEGPGIPADELPKLFLAFGQTSVQPTDGEPSTGLGLAIVKRIVEGHGGHVHVESTPGVGSTFSFSLPRNQPR
ncbi:MAG: HAMP domain-containing sensor histidine kinase [Rhodothermales bacterium]